MIALCLACTWERKKISFWELPPQKHINSISNLKSPWDQPCLPPRLLLRHWPPAASTANCGGTGAVAKLPCETVNTAGSSSGWRWRPFQSCSLGWSSHQTTSSMLLLFRLALHVSQNHLQAAYGYWPLYPVRVLGCFHSNSNGCPWCLLCISDSPIRGIEESLQILTAVFLFISVYMHELWLMKCDKKRCKTHTWGRLGPIKPSRVAQHRTFTYRWCISTIWKPISHYQ